MTRIHFTSIVRDCVKCRLIMKSEDKRKIINLFELVTRFSSYLKAFFLNNYWEYILLSCKCVFALVLENLC